MLMTFLKQSTIIIDTFDGYTSLGTYYILWKLAIVTMFFCLYLKSISYYKHELSNYRKIIIYYDDYSSSIKFLRDLLITPSYILKTGIVFIVSWVSYDILLYNLGLLSALTLVGNMFLYVIEFGMISLLFAVPNLEI